MIPFEGASLRGRLLLWIGALLVLILSGFGVTAYQLNRREQMAELDERLARWVASLVRDVRGPYGPGSGGNSPPQGFRPPPREESTLNRNPEETVNDSPLFPTRFERAREGREPPSSFGRDPGRPRRISLSSENREVFAGSGPSDPYFQIWSREGFVMGTSGFVPDGLQRPPSSGASAGVTSFTRHGYREAFYVTERGDQVLVGILQAPQMEGARRFGVWLVVAGTLVLVIGVGGAGWLVSRAIKPVEEIAAAATRISQGTLTDRIDANGMPRELARLAAVLNRSFSKLASTLEDQKRFTADASHELRTPLAVMITEAQSTLARERSVADYREALEGCLDTAQRMRRLTDMLLQFARFDAGQEEMARQHVDLAEVVEGCVERLRPLAEKQHLTLVVDLQPTDVLGDTLRLVQVVTNLVQNAIHYTPARGSVQVSLETAHAQVQLKVVDTGIGISATDLPRVFDRFFRADRARSGGEGRTGLGLAISQAIVQAHGGRIVVESTLGVGTCFTVHLPREKTV